MLQVCREIKDTKLCGIDTETTGKDNWMKDFILFWSLSPSADKRYCLSRKMLDIFKEEVSQDPSITWAMTNANFDNCMLANSGVPLMAGQIHCTLVMDWMHDENRTGRHGLKQTASDHLDLDMNEFKKVFKKQKSETYQDTLLRMIQDKPDEAIDYASMDAWASRSLHEYLKKELEGEETYLGVSLWDIYEKIEVPYSRVLYHNIRRGLMLDQGWLKQIRVPITERMESVLYQFNKMAGTEVNLNSPKQLVELFIEKLKKKPLKWTSGGKSGNKQPSVDEAVLQIWADEGDEHAKLLMEYRGLAKVRGTYVDGMLERVGQDGKIHPTINQHITVTGRLSSSNPNLQNIPRPDDDVWGLRGAFMPSTGHTLVAVDYKQLEMRLLAHMSGDENMRDVIRKGWDIHGGTAALMYNVPYEEIEEAKFLKGWLNHEHVDKSKWPEWISIYCGYRQDSKTIGFGLNYGKGDTALGMELGISREEAAIRKAKYFKPYPKVKEFIENTNASCRETLQVHTILGRKRRLLEANADWKEGFYSHRYKSFVPERPGPLAARALRQAVNSIIQGCRRVTARVTTTYGMRTMEQLYNDQAIGNNRPLVTHSGQTSNYTIHCTGKKKIFQLSTTHGTDYVTKKHRFFHYKEMDLEDVQLKDLKIGDFIVAHGVVVNNKSSSFEGSTVLAELIGVLCGDGSYTRDRDFRICFGNDMGWGRYLQSLLRQEFGKDLHCPISPSLGSEGESYQIEVSCKAPRQVLLDAGLCCASKENKRIPEWIFHASIVHRIACLRGLYDSDGGLLGGRYPQFTNISLFLVEGFQTLCHSLGLFCRVAPDNNIIGKPAYRATVIPEQAEEFIEIVRPVIEHKQQLLKKKNRVHLPPDLVKDVAKHILDSMTWSATSTVTKELSNNNEGSWRNRKHTYCVKKHFTHREQAHVYRMKCGSGTREACLKFLNRLLENKHDACVDTLNLIDLCNHHWAQIRSIELVGIEPTMDIEIFDEDHSYVGNGLLQHNSAADVARLAQILCEPSVMKEIGLQDKFTRAMENCGTRQLLQVHDEILFEVPNENLKEAIEAISGLMEKPFGYIPEMIGVDFRELSIPLDVDAGYGEAWSEAH
jgi:DNA polymerase I-like protein with 3'-5' exonuclease and polymerase domains